MGLRHENRHIPRCHDERAEVKPCKTCKHWQTIPVQGNERSEPAMIKMGYRNCEADKSVVGSGRYLHGEAKGCDKWTM